MWKIPQGCDKELWLEPNSYLKITVLFQKMKINITWLNYILYGIPSFLYSSTIGLLTTHLTCGVIIGNQGELKRATEIS